MLYIECNIITVHAKGVMQMAKSSPAKKAACAKPAKCAATTAAGTKCKRTASGRSKFCSSHKKK